MDAQIFWTSDAGRTWAEIGPAITPGATVQDVQFIDSQTGLVLLAKVNSNGDTLFELTQTKDAGVTWTMKTLSLFDSGQIAPPMEKADMGWFDAQTGWISVKQVSGSNFSIGTLFTTSDGGDTWTHSSLPVADRIVFDDPQTGWATAGPAGDQIFKTQDAGRTWQNFKPDNIPHAQVTVYPPYVSGDRGVLVMTAQNSLNIYHLETSTNHWVPLESLSLKDQPGMIGLSILDAQNFVATIPGTNSIARMTAGELTLLTNKDAQSASIVDLDMISLDVGWAKSVISKCDSASSPTDRADSVTCAITTRLIQTTDGGLTWQNIVLPFARSNNPAPVPPGMDVVTITNTVPGIGNTNQFTGQGFDKCEVPTLTQMQTWWDNSPYKTVNLYIGGSSRACSNNALTASYLAQLNQQGWQFIPTWVGPQAPCTGYLSRITNDVAIAHDEGVNEANLAVEQLATLGLTFPDQTGSVVYYDMEYYGTNTDCRNVVNAFMDGWVSQLHTLGNLAGVYGSTLCDTGLSDFLTIPNVPDAIWPARWYHNSGQGSYDPTATVWGLGSCIPDTVWANHQRVRQYEGDHNELWGGLSLGIDSDVLDGVVATSYLAPLVKKIKRSNASPTSAARVDFIVRFTEPVTGVDGTDFALATTGVTGAVITNLSGSGSKYRVTVNTGSGNGTIRLDVLDNDTILDGFGTPLGGTGSGNGSFTNGQVYDVIKSATFNSQNTRDGWTLESSETSNKGGSVDTTSSLLYVGDDAQNEQYKSFLSFKTDSLPDNAVITHAELKIEVQGFASGDMFTPIKTHGNLVMDIRTPYFGADANLAAADFQSAASRNSVGVLKSAPTLGWYTIPLKATAFPYLNLTGITQFRLRFQQDDNNDMVADYIMIFSGDAPAEDRPQLIIEYYVP